MHNRMSSPFFVIITTIGDDHGGVKGRTILADNNPLIRSAIFSRYLGATGCIRCAIGLATPTSISQSAPRDAGSKSFPFPINRWWLFRISCRNFFWSSVNVTPGYRTWKSPIIISSKISSPHAVQPYVAWHLFRISHLLRDYTLKWWIDFISSFLRWS